MNKQYMDDEVKILIVEDESIIAHDLKLRVESMGYSVCATVDSCTEAINMAEKQRPDLVLMDIMLHGHDHGIKAALQIHSEFDIPIIYLTAHADGSILEKAKPSEPFGYIVKPFQDRELNANIEMALYKSRMEREFLKNEKLKAMRTFISGLANDFNNLLMIILGYISLTMDKLEVHATAIEFLKEAESASLCARDLIQKLIFFLLLRD
jgi:CheY-like chemotaxis protein